MDTKKILANLKGTALYVLLPVMMVACNSKKANVDAELADVNAKLETVSARVDSTKAQIETTVADSIANLKSLNQMGENIARHEKEFKKLTSPRDSVRRKKFSKKIGTLRMDSILFANNAKANLTQQQMEAHSALFKEYDALVAKRDSLMKIKTR